MRIPLAITACLMLVTAGTSWAAEGAPAAATDQAGATQGVQPAAAGNASAQAEGAKAVEPESTAAQAEGARPVEHANAAAHSAWPAGLTFGAEVYHDRYAEPGVMREHGMMYGVTGSYTRRSSPCMQRLEARAAFGELDYFSPVAGSIHGIPDVALEVRSLVGRDFPTRKSTTLTPYAGLATRYLWDDSGGKETSGGYLGYDRESGYLYTPIGVSSSTPLCKDWSFGATFEYDLFWFGRQISHLSDVSKGLPDVANDQHHGFGWRGSVKFVKQLRKRSLVIEPFVRYWHIGNSAASFGGIEPDNRTVEAGLDVSVDF